jgi:hypothetical protein
MATPSAGDFRNFAIVGHASSGKTILSEAMLACAGVIGRMGKSLEAFARSHRWLHNAPCVSYHRIVNVKAPKGNGSAASSSP